MGDIDIVNLVSHLIIYMVVLLLAISCHEAGHAWVSYKFGDDTAYMLGRVTINPVRHTDPIGTLLMRLVSAADAVAVVRSGDRIYVHCAAATPSVLLDALVARAEELRDVTVVHLHTEGPGPHMAPEMEGHFRHRAHDDRQPDHDEQDHLVTHRVERGMEPGHGQRAAPASAPYSVGCSPRSLASVRSMIWSVSTTDRPFSSAAFLMSS